MRKKISKKHVLPFFELLLLNVFADLDGLVLAVCELELQLVLALALVFVAPVGVGYPVDV